MINVLGIAAYISVGFIYVFAIVAFKDMIKEVLDERKNSSSKRK